MNWRRTLPILTGVCLLTAIVVLSRPFSVPGSVLPHPTPPASASSSVIRIPPARVEILARFEDGGVGIFLSGFASACALYPDQPRLWPSLYVYGSDVRMCSDGSVEIRPPSTKRTDPE